MAAFGNKYCYRKHSKYQKSHKKQLKREIAYNTIKNMPESGISQCPSYSIKVHSIYSYSLAFFFCIFSQKDIMSQKMFVFHFSKKMNIFMTGYIFSAVISGENSIINVVWGDFCNVIFPPICSTRALTSRRPRDSVWSISISSGKGFPEL